jgi:hypothetical protein
MDQDYRPWLRSELAKHPQPCVCVPCASARAELLLLGEQVDAVALTVEQVLRRAR